MTQPHINQHTVIDCAAFAETTGGDTALQADLAHMFCATAPDYFSKLRAAVGDEDAWARASHTLKGAALIVAAQALAEACRKAQDTSGDAARVETLDLVRAALQAAMTELAATFPKTNRASS